MNSQSKIATLVAERVQDHQVANFLKRGMNCTGRTAKSWQVELGKVGSDSATAFVTALQHVIFLDKGVKASNVPYQRGSGKKSSKFINGLITYFRNKGLGEKEAKNAAFATANAAKKRGMPADKNKLGFLTLSKAQQKDVYEYAASLTDSWIESFEQTGV